VKWIALYSHSLERASDASQDEGGLNQMSETATDAVPLREYLLGQLSEEQQKELEVWLMTESDAYDLIAVAEDDLIDDWISRSLHRWSEEKFRRHFLMGAERRRKVQFSEAFRNFIDLHQQSREAAQSPSCWERVAAFFRLQPVFAAATASLLCLVVAGGAWMIQLQTHLDSAAAQTNRIERQRVDIAHQLDESRTQSKQMAAQLVQLKNVITDIEASAKTTAVLTLSLAPSIRTRGVNGPTPTAKITTRAQLLRFSLALLENEYSSYQVVLYDDNGDEVWRREEVAATDSDEGSVVLVNVSTENMRDGDYRLKLIGTAPPDVVASYDFHVEYLPAK